MSQWLWSVLIYSGLAILAIHWLLQLMSQHRINYLNQLKKQKREAKQNQQAENHSENSQQDQQAA